MTTANSYQVGGDHYKKQVIQVWDYIVANGIPYLEGNAIKYLSRWRDKGGIEDLKKAKQYVEKLIEEELKSLENKAKTSVKVDENEWQYVTNNPIGDPGYTDKLLNEIKSYGRPLGKFEINEGGMLLSLREWVVEMNKGRPGKKSSRLADPDYNATKFYCPQWKRHGALLYYKYKDNHPVAARIDMVGGGMYCFYNPDGLELNALVTFTEKTR